jgi:hypothetical protein
MESLSRNRAPNPAASVDAPIAFLFTIVRRRRRATEQDRFRRCYSHSVSHGTPEQGRGTGLICAPGRDDDPGNSVAKLK